MTKTTTSKLGSGPFAQLKTDEAKVFVALSPGLGLGEPRAKPAPPMPSKQTKRSGLASMWPDEAALAPPLAARSAAPSPKRRARAQSPSPKWRQGSAYVMDFFIVTSSVALCLVAASLAMRVHSDAGIGAWALRLKFFDPVTWSWLRDIPVYQVLFGVYAVFFLYLLIFRLLVGRTLGQALLSLKLGRKAS